MLRPQHRVLAIGEIVDDSVLLALEDAEHAPRPLLHLRGGSARARKYQLGRPGNIKALISQRSRHHAAQPSLAERRNRFTPLLHTHAGVADHSAADLFGEPPPVLHGVDQHKHGFPLPGDLDDLPVAHVVFRDADALAKLPGDPLALLGHVQMRKLLHPRGEQLRNLGADRLGDSRVGIAVQNHPGLGQPPGIEHAIPLHLEHLPIEERHQRGVLVRVRSERCCRKPPARALARRNHRVQRRRGGVMALIHHQEVFPPAVDPGLPAGNPNPGKLTDGREPAQRRLCLLHLVIRVREPGDERLSVALERAEHPVDCARCNERLPAARRALHDAATDLSQPVNGVLLVVAELEGHSLISSNSIKIPVCGPQNLRVCLSAICPSLP